MKTCKLCNVRHPSFYCRKQDLLDKQARKLQKLIKESLKDPENKLSKCNDPDDVNWYLQSLLEESEK